MKTKTVVFDLDDTLVKEIDFLKSAFLEIAKFVDKSNSSLYSQMLDWYYNKQNVFQSIISQYPAIDIKDLKNIYRNHFPDFSKYEHVRKYLVELKNKGHKLGLITDGFSVTQRNKIKSLRIEDLFDLIVISEEFGSEKPNEDNFKIFHQYNSDEYYYIGDNVSKDFVTPNKLGWKTICLVDDGSNIHKQDFNKEVVYLPQTKVENIQRIKLETD
jgi:putative hydrolase of the HAD superfamily